ncbi:MAG TPA: hypothetical protein VN848_10275 [Gemmatimonadales bacterium]|nr:hypothetical protein [Gemmatimonadales bacterium]
MHVRSLLVVTLGLVSFSALKAQGRPLNPVCKRLLPAALVGRLAGEPKTALIPRQVAIGAGGDCNYVADPSAAKPQLILMADINQVAGHRDFVRYVGPIPNRPVPGLGDEANAVKTIVAARKGALLVVVSSFQKVDLKTQQAVPYFTRDQLIELVRQALAKK